MKVLIRISLVVLAIFLTFSCSNSKNKTSIVEEKQEIVKDEIVVLKFHIQKGNEQNQISFIDKMITPGTLKSNQPSIRNRTNLVTAKFMDKSFEKLFQIELGHPLYPVFESVSFSGDSHQTKTHERESANFQVRFQNNSYISAIIFEEKMGENYYLNDTLFIHSIIEK